MLPWPLGGSAGRQSSLPVFASMTRAESTELAAGASDWPSGEKATYNVSQLRVSRKVGTGRPLATSHSRTGLMLPAEARVRLSGEIGLSARPVASPRAASARATPTDARMD